MSRAGDNCVRFCSKLQGLPATVLCISLFILQSAIMDYYLVHHLSVAHLSWMAGDLVNLTLLITCIFFVHPIVNKGGSPGQHSMFSIAWIFWLTTSALVAAKTICIFTLFATELEEEAPTFFGPNTLKTSIALGSCVFLLLLLTQHSAPLSSENRRYIEELTGTVVFDLLDTVDILDVLFDEDMQDLLSPGLREFILSVATLNLLIPTVPLFTLSRTKFGYAKLQKRLVYTHRLLLVLLVNVPNLLARLILWHGFSVGVSPFTLKNIILICMTFYEFYEHKQEKFEEHEREKAEMHSVDSKNWDSSSNIYSRDSGTGDLQGDREKAGKSNGNFNADDNDDDEHLSYHPQNSEISGEDVGYFPIEERMVTSI